MSDSLLYTFAGIHAALLCVYAVLVCACPLLWFVLRRSPHAGGRRRRLDSTFAAIALVMVVAIVAVVREAGSTAAAEASAAGDPIWWFVPFTVAWSMFGAMLLIAAASGLLERELPPSR
jgi:hypothetical protein